MVPNGIETDIARLKTLLEKAFIKAPKKELNEMIWNLILEHLSPEDSEETKGIISKFFAYGIEINIRPNFQIVGFVPVSLTKDKRSN